MKFAEKCSALLRNVSPDTDVYIMGGQNPIYIGFDVLRYAQAFKRAYQYMCVRLWY